MNLDSINDYKKFNSAEFDPATGAYKAKQGNGQEGADSDGEVEEDESVIKKILGVNNWVAAEDGYWYWNGVLDADGGKTDPLLKELVMASNIDLGFYDEKEYYAIVGKDDSEPPFYKKDGAINEDVWKTASWETPEQMLQWADEKDAEGELKNIKPDQKMYRRSVSSVDEEKTGYSDARYTLTITSEFVQANADAVDATWENFEWRDILTNVVVNDDSTLSNTSGNTMMPDAPMIAPVSSN